MRLHAEGTVREPLTRCPAALVLEWPAMTDGTPAPRCYLHIGLQKTGTSYLQAVFWQSQAALADHRLEMLPGTKKRTFEVTLATRERADVPGDPLHDLAREARAAQLKASASAYLLSQESLAAASAAQARRLAEHLPGMELHLVITVRDLGRLLPSVWQQKLSARKSYTFDEFLDAVVRGGGRAREFWRNQDLPAVLGRWSAVVPPERTHLVTVPPAGSPPGLLLERFCQVLGVDPDILDRDVPRNNASLGREQAELLRRVNLALGDRLAGRTAYRPVKLYFAKRVLASQPGRPARTPARLESWCRELAAEHIRFVADGGYDVVGTLDDLVPLPGYFTDEEHTVTEQDVSGAAAEALATMLVDRQRGVERRRGPEPSQERGGLGRRLGRVLRRPGG